MNDDRRLEELKRAVQKNPDAPDLGRELLRALFRANRITEARKRLTRELERDRLRDDLRSLAWDQARLLLDDGPWPTAQADIYNRRLSTHQGARRGRVLHQIRVGAGPSARFGIGGEPERVAAIAASNERVFFSTDHHRVLAFDPTNWSRVWDRAWDQPIQGPSIDLGGLLYVHSASGPAILDPANGDPLTGEASIDQAKFGPGGAIGSALPMPDGRLLSPRRQGLALHESQEARWQKTVAFDGRLRGPPVMTAEGLIVFVPSNRLVLVDLEGPVLDELTWSAKDGYMPGAGLIFDPEESRLLLSQPHRDSVDAHCLIVDLDAGRFHRRTRNLSRVEVLALGPDGRRLIRIAGREVSWLDGLRKAEVLGPTKALAGVAVDAAGIAFLAGDGRLRAIAPGGRPLFELALPAPLSCGPVIGPQGTTLLGLENGIVLVLD